MVEATAKGAGSHCELTWHNKTKIWFLQQNHFQFTSGND